MGKRTKVVFSLVITAILIFLSACEFNVAEYLENQQNQANSNSSYVEYSNDTLQYGENNLEIQPNEVFVRPDTNLEFWLGDNVNGFDWSPYEYRDGLFGGREYYGLGYIPIRDEMYGRRQDPEHCVVYRVTGYPDCLSKSAHITHIYITDPSIYINDISLNTELEEIKEIMINNGFTITDNISSFVAEKGKIWCSFGQDCFRLSLEVTNIHNIVY